MADQLTRGQYLELKKAFELFDTDHDGTINIRELGAIMAFLGYHPTTAELQKLINEVDLDSEGHLDFTEFVTIMAKQINYQEAEDKIIDAFRIFDKEQKGYISIMQLRYILTKLGDKLTIEEVENMIQEAGLENEDYLHYEEFVLMLARC